MRSRSPDLLAGFTPTCVGIARASADPCRSAPVHPHLRGDRLRERQLDNLRSGSPPLAWGSRCADDILNLMPRFTPTCVGIAAVPVPRITRTPVHPHLRGDRSMRRETLSKIAGSPPLAWGSPSQSNTRRLHLRFTPTCVGIADRGRHSDSASRVHPHLRGDRCLFLPLSVSSCGSPPLAWGSQLTAWRSHMTRRFTPTCVGIARMRHQR